MTSEHFYNFVMQIFKNYYVRWFLFAFVFGAVLLPSLFFGWILFEQFSTLRQFQSQGLPVSLVTNPFIEITNPFSGKVIASSKVAFLIAAVLCGVITGILGVCIGGFNRLIRNPFP